MAGQIWIENFVNASVSVFCNTGTALPTTASSTLTTSAYPGNVITGNFCNNGRADLTVSSTTANVVNVFCNVTTGLAVSTANAQGLGEIIQASSNQTANLFQVQNSSGTSLDTIDGSGDLTVSDNSTTTNTGVLTVNATGLTTGYAENINVNAATTLTTGGALNIVGPSNTANLSGGTGLVDIQAAGAFTTSAGVGGLLQVNTATKTGTAVSIVGIGTMTTTGNLLTVTANSATTATGILTVNATGLTTGYAEYINVKSTTALTTGGALQVVGPSGAAGLSSGTGLVDIQETGVITTSTGVGGLLQLSTATVTGTAASIVGTGTMTTTGNLLTVTDNSATTVTGLVTINGSGLTTGSALNINAGTGTALTIDSGSTLNLASATTGNTAILKIPQDTSSTDCSSGTHEGVEIQNNSGTQVGHICINGASATTAPGDLEYYAQAFNASSTDVAENYSDVDNNLAPGDVVALAGDGASSDDIIKGSQDNLSSVIGVVSTSPGILLSGIEDSGGTNLINPEPVALSGRIPTNVTSENGPIEPGDYLTASATMPGYAMKATQAGNVIGQAITGYSGSGTGQVIMFVKATYYAGPSVTQTLQSASLANITASNLITTNSLQVNGLATISSLLTNNANIQTLNVSGTATIQNLTVISGITSQNLTVTGSADVTNLTVDNGISLGSNNEDPTQQNTHPITIRMVANGPISAGSVVVTDPTDGPGYVEQASQNGSTEVIGVAITSSTSKGNIIQIAVGGTADVAVPEGSNVSIGQLLESGATGNAITSSKIGPGQLLGKVLGTINPNNQVLILITL